MSWDTVNAAIDKRRLAELTRAVPSSRRRWTRLSVLAAVVLNFSMASPAGATVPVSSLFWSICIGVYDLRENLDSKSRNDLAERVSSALQVKLAAVERGRTASSEPNCIKPNQPGFDRQMALVLSVKRQEIEVDGKRWNLVIAGGVSANGLFQDRDLQPVVVVKRQPATDDEVVEALVKFVDRSVVDTVRQQRQR